MKSAVKVFGVIILGALVVSCLNRGDNGETARATSAAAQSPTSTAPAAADYCSYSRAGFYVPDGTCREGGEVVTVRQVVEGDLYNLADGRSVRLLGVDAVDLDECAGQGAKAFAQALAEGKEVKLLSDPNVDRNDQGQLLRYVQVSESRHDRTGLPVFSKDVGDALVLGGWALPFGPGSNPDYQADVIRSKEIAEYQPDGMYADPCGKPKVYGDEDGNGVADYEEKTNVDVDVDFDSPNLPDGALTGGYCARKWWC